MSRALDAIALALQHRPAGPLDGSEKCQRDSCSRPGVAGGGRAMLGVVPLSRHPRRHRQVLGVFCYGKKMIGAASLITFALLWPAYSYDLQFTPEPAAIGKMVVVMIALSSLLLAHVAALRFVGCRSMRHRQLPAWVLWLH